MDNEIIAPTAVAPETVKQGETTPDESTSASVHMWLERFRDAKKKWEPDFKRMKENMAFAAGMQWADQDQVDSDKYVVNLTLRSIQDKVASLYARDPKAVARRRQRLDFSVWDEKMETLMQAVAAVGQAQQMGAMQPPVDAMAIIADYENGRKWRDQLNKIARTMEILYQYQVDAQQPPFKTLMKSLVRRVITTGVGYVRIGFERQDNTPLQHTEVETSDVDRMKTIKMIAGKLSDGDIDEDDAQVETLKSLLFSLGGGQSQPPGQELSERLLFDFPPASSIIPDPRCRNLKDFVGARWIAQEFILPLDEVNSFFGTDIKVGGEIKVYNEHGEQSPMYEQNNKSNAEATGKPMVCLVEIIDYVAKNHFYIVDGYKDYVCTPCPVEPDLAAFWPIFALTFNEIETENGSKATIFPPSDAQLMKSAQKEWNRTREANKKHRRANGPKYITNKGWLTAGDKEKLISAQDNEVIELEGLPTGMTPSQALAAFQHAPLDPQVYDTNSLRTDILLSVGQQQADLGPTSGATATEASISEHSKMSSSASNVDDLDDLLTKMAKAGGETLLKEMSPQTVTRIVGQGAVWPTVDPQPFLDELYLEIEAASSGRPNKAVEISNFMQLAPILQQAGANPQFIIRQAIKRLDERIDIDEAFPLVPPTPPEGTQAPQGPMQTQRPPLSSNPGNDGGPQPSNLVPLPVAQQ